MGRLLYYVHKEKLTKVSEIAGTLGLETRKLEPADLGKSLSRILEEKGLGRDPGEGSKSQIPAFYSMPEALIFCGLGEGQLDAFLEAYRASGLAPIACKAVVTPTNLQWTLYDLLEELKKEDRQMHNP